MKPYLPYRDATAFELRRTAFLASPKGRGSFLADDGADFALGDLIDGDRVEGITYSLYAVRDDEPGFHITDENSPRAIRAYAARIARGRPFADRIPDDRAGETVPTPAMIAWAKYQRLAQANPAADMSDLGDAWSRAAPLMEPPDAIGGGSVSRGGIAFYEAGAPWRFIHKGSREAPLVSAFFDPKGEQIARPDIWDLISPWCGKCGS
ncbi:MAG: hypothetical protein AAFN79_12325 [Pseudomonadota bacterium]